MLTWKSYLRAKTRNPQFLWRMVFVILGVGVAVGLLADGKMTGGAIDAVQQVAESQSRARDFNELAAGGNWAELWQRLPEAYAWRTSSAGPLVLAATAGLCWLAFSLQAAEVRRDRGRLAACLAGVGLGILSIWPTLFFIYWQEHAWNLRDGVELADAFRYNILGVGLREETAKLLCLLPLLPWMVARRDELGALMASACVGLGFAVEENCNYFVGVGGVDVLGRLLTANPFHMALTGLVGLAVYRAVLWPKQRAPQAVAVFGIAVLAHGAYDALLSIAALADYALGGTIVFAGVIYQFFRELRSLRSPDRDPVSLTATFLGGVCVTAAVTFVYLSGSMGLKVACDMLVNGIAGSAVMAYLFLREMPETMVTV
jgi:RsiW-degrading membrane proteinase PrsW (M82 family)